MSPYEAVLALEDGSKFYGSGFGAPAEVSGEVVFNTGMVGYLEALTDASYAGQILVQTYPLVGNYGVPSKVRRDAFGFPCHLESERVQVAGYVVHSPSRHPSHRTSDGTLGRWLREQNVPAISGIDTRRLTKKLRTRGVMLGILKVDEEIDADELDDKIRGIPDPSRMDLVRGVTIEEPIIHRGSGPRIVLIDCGVKLGIVRSLLARGATVIRVPYTYPADGILDFDPSGVVISNGPGEPKMCVETIGVVGELLETDLPLMGICLGNQLLALAAGGDTYKLKFGHRGQNHPCVDLSDGRCYITSQNHGFAVDAESLGDTGFEASFINANDGTNEGIRHRSKPVFGVQFHPEGSPGPLDAEFLFDEFLKEARGCCA
ncbi:MAG: glutamine-hydrolyzing carbamoyl-phosphate synthase small subunit [Candidatus Bathyarchaeia archaeon]